MVESHILTSASIRGTGHGARAHTHRSIFIRLAAPDCANFAGEPCIDFQVRKSQRAPPLEHGSPSDGLPGSVFRGGGIGALVQFSSRQQAYPEAATEVGHSRDHSSHHSVHTLLRNPLLAGLATEDCYEGVGAIVGTPA